MSEPLQNSLTPADRQFLEFLASLEVNHSRTHSKPCACTGCGKDENTVGRRMLRCSGCDTVLYCSKECQKRNWPVHKGFCGEAAPGKLIGKLVNALISSPLLLAQLQACVIVAFDLLNRARSGEFLLARLDIGIEPADIADFEDIFLGKGRSKKNVQGMLQLNAFSPNQNPGRFAAEREAAWRRAREKGISAGLHDNTVVLVDFTYANSPISCNFPVQIIPPLRKVAKTWMNDSLVIRSAKGDTIRLPYTIENCMQRINMLIRADTNNQLLLRTKMRQFDIQTIRNVATSADSLPAMILHAKIARENIYNSIYHTFVERQKAATGVAPSIVPENTEFEIWCGDDHPELQAALLRARGTC